jgi:DNA-binding LacI/PurR family transcriptional regulator
MATPTIRDVARLAGVGVGTVSRVLNNHPHVSDRTRARVEGAIKQLSFRPNTAARQLISGVNQRTIGVLLPYVSYAPFVERLKGIQATLSAEASAFDLVLYNVQHPERIAEQVNTIATQRSIEGLLVISVPLAAEQLSQLTQAGIRVAGIYDRAIPAIPCLALDNVKGGFMATDYLARMGHKRIAYVGDAFPDEYGFPTSEDRLAGYYQAMQQHNLAVPKEYVQLGRHGREVAYELGRQLLRLPAPPTAIFAMSDMQALGVISAIREVGLNVPEHISVIGFDDIEVSQYVGLTTIRQHLQESGTLAIKLLLSHLENNPIGMAMPQLRLVERTSTQRYKGKV